MGERLVELDVDWGPDVGSPLPILWQTEDRAFLIFTSSRSGTRVAVEFQGCLVAQFGYPNDEALEGHPLYRLGLRPYGVFEVIGSSWLERLILQNRAPFPSSSFDGYRHFVITFHDSVFECLARGYAARDLDIAEVQRAFRESAETS